MFYFPVLLFQIQDFAMELFDYVFAKIIFDLLLLDENDLMKSKIHNNFPNKKKIQENYYFLNQINIRHNRYKEQD